jgi:hypothetical protein
MIVLLHSLILCCFSVIAKEGPLLLVCIADTIPMYFHVKKINISFAWTFQYWKCSLPDLINLYLLKSKFVLEPTAVETQSLY